MSDIKNTEINSQDDHFLIKIFNRISDYEKTVLQKYDAKEIENKTRFEELYSKIDELTLKTSDLQKNTLKLINSYEKFPSIESNQGELFRRMTNLEVLVDNTNKSLKDTIVKYDRIYLENLFIPGIIGENSCRFKNMNEFIENQLNFYTVMMNFKEQASLDLKSNKSRLDSVIKSNNSSINDLENSMKNYSNLLINNHDANVKANIDLIGDQIQAVRMENNRYALELKNSSNDLKSEIQKSLEKYNEITQQMENLSNSYKEINVKTVESFNEHTQEFEGIKRRFNDIAEFIKDLRFKKNLQEVNMMELRRLSNKIGDNGNNKDKSPVLLPKLIKQASLPRIFSDDEKFKQENPFSDEDDKFDLKQSIELDNITKPDNLPLKRREKNPIRNFNTIAQKFETSKKLEISEVNLPISKISETTINDQNFNVKKVSDVFVSKVNFEGKEKILEKIPATTTNKTSFRDEFSNKTDVMSYFFDKINYMKKEYFSRYKTCEIKINEMESNIRQSFESLISQVKSYIPNVNTENFQFKLKKEELNGKKVKELEAPIARLDPETVLSYQKDIKYSSNAFELHKVNELKLSQHKNVSNKSIFNHSIKIKNSQGERRDSNVDVTLRSKSLGMKNIMKN